MFEVEKDLKTIDCKPLKYMFCYGGSLIRYRKEKIRLPYLEIWATGRCNLRCQDCLSLLPYVEGRKTDTKRLIENLKKLLLVARVDKLLVGGGEPLLNAELSSLLEAVRGNCPDSEIYLFTNGTVMPGQRLLEEMGEAGKKLKVIVNCYPGSEEEARQVYEKLREARILCQLRQPKTLEASKWKTMGGPLQKTLHFETSRFLHRECPLRNYAVLHGDELTVCPRGIYSSAVFGRKKKRFEHVKVSKLRDNAFSRARVAVCMNRNIYKDYCRNCLSMSPENPYRVMPGVQCGMEYERKQV